MMKDLEIEKKYIIDKLEDVMEYVDLDACNKLIIEQGYLASSPTIRVRKYNDEYCITYKSRIKSNDMSDVIVNKEVELPLTEESYRNLVKKVDYNVVTKTRYIIDIANGLKAELDVFEGKLKGLVMVEVEFADEESAKNFIKPEWFGQDVSALKQYKNLYLAQVENVSDVL